MVCQMSTHVCIALLEHASLLSVHYQFCCRINGAIDQWQTCVSCKMADQSPTAEPDIRAPINTTTVGMIVDMLGLSCWRPAGYSFLLQQASINRWGDCGKCNMGGAEKAQHQQSLKQSCEALSQRCKSLSQRLWAMIPGQKMLSGDIILNLEEIRFFSFT